MLVSTYEMRNFAAQASRPFEAAVASLVIGELLALLSPGLEFHEENRGCIFDFNGDRQSIVESLRQMQIEPECLRRIKPAYRTSADALITALRELPGSLTS